MTEKNSMIATNGEVLAITQVLNKMAKLPTLPVKGKYWIGRDVKLFRDIAATIEEQRKALLDKYADKDDKGKPIIEPVEVDGKMMEKFKMSDEDAFREELQGLFDIETDVEFFPIKLEMLGEAEGITANEMVALDILIEAE